MKRGKFMYVPRELVIEIENIQKAIGISNADAIRVILKKKNHGDDSGGFRI